MTRFFDWLFFFFRFSYGVWLAGMVYLSWPEGSAGWAVGLVWYVLYNVASDLHRREMKHMVKLLDIIIDASIDKQIYESKKASRGKEAADERTEDTA